MHVGMWSWELEPLLSSDTSLKIAQVTQSSWDLEASGMGVGQESLGCFYEDPINCSLNERFPRILSSSLFDSLFRSELR